MLSGNRLIRNINGFIQQEGLQDTISQKRPPKRAKLDTKKATPAPVSNADDSFDEFDIGVDFSTIDIP